MGGAGAYCSSMGAKNYNSFPESAEVLIEADSKTVRLVRKRQDPVTITANELVE